jgi:phosphoenolpyruvate synthase/pyruvate phosphate dikinase
MADEDEGGQPRAGGAALVLPLSAVGAGDRPVVGGKAASLGELARAGLRVPPGCVVTTAAFVAAMRAVDPDGSLARQADRLDPDDLEQVARVTAGIRDRITAAPLPGALASAIAAGYRALGPRSPDAVPVAVRSSAIGEDAADASFAGLQDTYLWVRGGEQVADRVRRCWASLYNVESVTYRLRHGWEATAMAVVVQRMVDARSAGVVFTRSPATGDRSVVTIEAGWGLGSAVVSGEVTPDTYVVSKVTGEVLRRTVASKLRRHRPDPAGSGVLDEEVPREFQDQPCLSDAEVQALARLACLVERHYGAAQDIEWALAPGLPPDHGLFLLQSRPETVWSRREPAPVATPKPRAFDHLAALFSGNRTAGGESRRA